MSKYQVLEHLHAKGSSSKYSIIMKPDDRGLWRMYIPDAGDRTSATQVTRLLNAEYETHKKILEEREERENYDIHG